MPCRNESLESPGSRPPGARNDVRQRWRGCLPVAVALTVLAPGRLAAAQGTATATEPPSAQHVAELAAQARKLCANENPQQGVAVLAELYVVTGHAAWVYNQGRCWEENGHYEKARLRFEEYLRKVEEITERDRRAVERRIEDLKRKSLQGNPTGGPAAATTANDSQPAAAPPSSQPLATDERPSETITATPEQQGWSWQRKTGLAGLTVGGMGVILGAVFQGVSHSRITAFNEAGCGLGDLSMGPNCQQRNDKIDSALAWQWTGYAGGAVLGAAGLYFYLTAPDGPWARTKDENRTGMAMICQPTLEKMGLSCGGRF